MLRMEQCSLKVDCMFLIYIFSFQMFCITSDFFSPAVTEVVNNLSILRFNESFSVLKYSAYLLVSFVKLIFNNTLQGLLSVFLLLAHFTFFIETFAGFALFSSTIVGQIQVKPRSNCIIRLLDPTPITLRLEANNEITNFRSSSIKFPSSEFAF